MATRGLIVDTFTAVADCITDTRDRFLIGQTPLLPAPKFGALPKAPLGRRQYIGATDGLYVQMHHHGLTATARLNDVALPFGTVTAGVELAGGLIPRELLHEIAAAAVRAYPKEWEGWVHWAEDRQRYQLTLPRVTSQSDGHVAYETRDLDLDRLVLHVHSHGPYPPFFSKTDDESDSAGCYFACVLGNCDSYANVQMCLRFVIDGHFFAVERPPWEQPSDRARASSTPSEKMRISVFHRRSFRSSDATDIFGTG
jgi:PRTRC genetic system protein A